MGTHIYVVTHKKTKIADISGYTPILVGADLHPEITDYKVKDNTGDNISVKNPNYCELTAVYWIWKNCSDDIIGIVHYRRFFGKRWYSGSVNNYISINEIKNVLSRKRIILPEPRHYNKSVLRSINLAPNMHDVKEMYEAIKSCSSEYLDDYIWFLEQNRAPLYNMFIMRWNDFNEYCSWLFEILSYIEERHDIESESAYRRRLYGFLSERLLSVWVHHNISENQIRHYPVINTEETELQRIRHKLADLKREMEYLVLFRSKEEIENNTILKEAIEG